MPKLVEFYVEIVDMDTDEVVEKLGPYTNERLAEKVENGVNINLNHEKFFTRRVP